MKKHIFFVVLAFLFIARSFFAEDALAEITYGVPQALEGIWEGSDRYIVFSNNSESSIYLKTFYSWYLDRSAEPSTFSILKRDSNDVTTHDAEVIVIGYRKTSPSSWDLVVKYPNEKNVVNIPIAVIDGKLYLDFMIRVLEDNFSLEQNLEGFWHGVASSSSISISIPRIKDKLQSMYITENAIYYLNFWETDMDYMDASAIFSDSDKTFSVLKHIRTAGKIFTCSSGRSLTIRNVEKSLTLKGPFVVDSTNTVMGLGSPYLTKVQDVGNEENLMKIVKETNSRFAPRPFPPFPESNLDWHLDEIHSLEKGNKIIEEVRKRQKEFVEKAQGTKIY